jgi:TolA-binding protein
MKEEEVIRLRTEAAKLGKMQEQYVQKLTQMEKRCASLEQEIKKLDGVIADLRKDLNVAKKYTESGKKTVYDLQRDRKVLKWKILKVSGMLLC